MPSGWSKGFTKENHSSLKKTSETMKKKDIDNFSVWRERMKKEGKIRTQYPVLPKNGDLAELIGVVLGDGHIRKFARVDELSIFSNSNNPGFVKRYARLVKKIFDKKPALTKHGDKNCTRIRIYQKFIQKRIGVPYSPRGKLNIIIPPWVLRDNEFIVRYLRGLYEAEGSHSVHLPTSTYKFAFSNRNVSMRRNVLRLMKKLGFHPHESTKNSSVQISRKKEVFEAMELLKFRKY